MSDDKPLTLSAVAVLKAVADGVRYGFDIMDATGHPSGTVYPILGRLERSGYVKSRWESDAQAQRSKRPPRRYYQTTAVGQRVLAISIEHYRTLGGLVDGARRPAPGPAQS
jgi:PadR family transcriptional regulator, regulatory protein PadR